MTNKIRLNCEKTYQYNFQLSHFTIQATHAKNVCIEDVPPPRVNWQYFEIMTATRWFAAMLFWSVVFM